MVGTATALVMMPMLTADADGGVSLKEGVSKDRMVSVHDPQMRHGHKSKRKRFDGHKAAVVVDTDSQLITAVDVLPGNAADNLGALELVEQSEVSADVAVVEAMGDTAYGDGGTRQAFADAGRRLVARVPGRPNRKCFPKDDFVIDLVAGKLHLSGGSDHPRHCAGGETHRQYWDGASSASLPVRRRGVPGLSATVPMLCRQRQEGPAGADPPAGRPCCKRPGHCSRAPTTTSTGNGGWWRSIDWLGWSSWASGRPVTSDGSRPSSSCTWRLRWRTLTLLSNQTGVVGDSGDNPDSIIATAAIGGNHGVDRRFAADLDVLAWLRSPTLALSLSPTRAFRPAF